MVLKKPMLGPLFYCLYCFILFCMVTGQTVLNFILKLAETCAEKDMLAIMIAEDLGVVHRTQFLQQSEMFSSIPPVFFWQEPVHHIIVFCVVDAHPIANGNCGYHKGCISISSIELFLFTTNKSITHILPPVSYFLPLIIIGSSMKQSFSIIFLVYLLVNNNVSNQLLPLQKSSHVWWKNLSNSHT